MVGTTSGFYTDLNDAQWAIVAPLLPSARPGGRPRTTCVRSVADAIFYLLRTGCQWRLLPRCFPPWSTVHHYFRTSVPGSVRACGSAFIVLSTRWPARPLAGQLARRW